VNVQPKPMTGAVHIELLVAAGLEDLVKRAVAEPEIDIALRQHAFRDPMIVVKIRPRHHRIDTGELRSEHELINILLRSAELAIDREGPRDVGCITVILATGVDQQQIAVLQLPVVVAIVQNARVRPAGDNRRIGDGLRAVSQEFMSKLGFAINNVTSTKQTVTGASGIVVLASHDNEASVDTLQADYYFHNYINLGGAVVTPTPIRTASPTATSTPTPAKPTATPTIGPDGLTKPRVYVAIVAR